MELSDGVPGTSKNIQILIGADYINKFLIQKREEHHAMGKLRGYRASGGFCPVPVVAAALPKKVMILFKSRASTIVLKHYGRSKSPWAETRNVYQLFRCTRTTIDMR